MTATVVPFRPSPEPAFVPEHVPVPEPEASVVDVVDTTEDFETLRDRARELIAKGSYQEAGAAYLQAVEVTTAAGETDLADEALCGWGAAETELGNGVDVMPELRRILLGSQVDHNRWLASYTIARAHELEGQIKKALFYAKLSRDISAFVDRRELMVSSYNLLGNLLVAEGDEAEAANCYRTALRGTDEAPPTWTAVTEVNLGYCLLARLAASRSGLHRVRLREGLRLAYKSLRTFRREGAAPLLVWPHLDLCFAYLQMERPRPAKRHGLRALEVAEKFHEREVVKNCLYLLGQSAVLEGDLEGARRFFHDLEQRFYPDRTGLADMLMAIDLRQVVNLRA